MAAEHGGGLTVNHAGLDEAADRLMTAMKKIDTDLDQLEADLQITRNQWAGEAQQAYISAKAKWDGAINEMVVLLSDTSKTVTTSNQEYRAADLRGRDAFQI